jgi:cytoskeletal protein CcmA (bactofilin family)
MIFGKRSSRSARRQLEQAAAHKAADGGGENTNPAVIRTPPMKPFARTTATLNLAPAPATPKSSPSFIPPAMAAATSYRPAEIAARPTPRGTPADPRRLPGQASQGQTVPGQAIPGQGIPGHTLVVGRDIRLTGEIRACERLVVEGSVEAELTDIRTLEIAESGHFRGSAAVSECLVSGTFDGDLTVSGLLAVRASGRVGGAVRYAEIEVERGGRITGRADLQGPQEVRSVETRPTGGLGLRPA